MKDYIYRHPFMLRVVKVVLGIRDLLFPVRGRDNKIDIHGNVTRLRKSIVGNHNVVKITNSNVDRATVRIRGNGNTLHRGWLRHWQKLLLLAGGKKFVGPGRMCWCEKWNP